MLLYWRAAWSAVSEQSRINLRSPKQRRKIKQPFSVVAKNYEFNYTKTLLKILSHLETLYMQTTITLREIDEDNSQFINQFEYFSIPLFDYDSWTYLKFEPYGAVVFDDNDVPHIKHVQDVSFSDPTLTFIGKEFYRMFNQMQIRPPEVMVELRTISY